MIGHYGAPAVHAEVKPLDAGRLTSVQATVAPVVNTPPPRPHRGAAAGDGASTQAPGWSPAAKIAAGVGAVSVFGLGIYLLVRG